MTDSKNVKFFNDKEVIVLLSLLAYAYERIENKQEINDDLFLIECSTQNDYLKLINNISSKTILFSITENQNKDLRLKIRDSINQDKIKKLLKKGC